MTIRLSAPLECARPRCKRKAVAGSNFCDLHQPDGSPRFGKMIARGAAKKSHKRKAAKKAFAKKAARKARKAKKSVKRVRKHRMTA